MPPKKSHASGETPLRKSLQALNAAFSLVEVALALGVVAFGLTAVLGLMPLGFTQFREAMDLTVSSQIKATVTADLKQMPFETLVANTTFPPRYFDDQGVEVSTAAEGLYTAIANVERGAKLAASTAPNPNLARVTVEILAHRSSNGQQAHSSRLAHSTILVAGVE